MKSLILLHCPIFLCNICPSYDFSSPFTLLFLTPAENIGRMCIYSVFSLLPLYLSHRVGFDVSKENGVSCSLCSVIRVLWGREGGAAAAHLRRHFFVLRAIEKKLKKDIYYMLQLSSTAMYL